MNASRTTYPMPTTLDWTDPLGGPSPRHAARAARRLAAFFLVILGGCGGGGSSSGSGSGQASPPDANSSGYVARVFPAQAGLVLTGHSAQGDALQQSTPTDDNGVANFGAAIAGSRLHATSKDTGWRVPHRRSARLLGDGQTPELTPLTTIFDQLVEAGLSEADAQNRIYDLLGATCTVTPQTLSATSMYGDHPLDAPAREWLLAALDAYVDSLGRLGLSPDTPGIDWPGLLGAHAALLTQFCSTARAVHSDGWLAAAADTLASRHGLTANDAARVLQLLRPQALALVLNRLADRIALLEHPSLGVTLEAQTPEWIGNPPAQVTQLIDAALTRSATSGGSMPTSMAGMALDRQGRIVQTVSAQTMWAKADSAPLRFVNSGSETRSVSITVNDAALDSMADLLFEILALPAEQADEPLQRRAWRYVVGRSAHSSPVTAGPFLHQAELYLRSVGRGLCDDVAHTLALIWLAMGYESRIVGLSGHVVSEVLYGGRWELYDADYRVYYLNRQGQVASVADIENDVPLMTSPLLRLIGTLEGAYGESLANIYASAHDNVVEGPLAYVSSAPSGPTFDLPAGASLDLRGAGAIAVPTIDSGIAFEAGSLELRLPPGFTGTVRLPYVLTDVTGEGRLAWIGRVEDVPPDGLAASIADRNKKWPYTGINSLDIRQVGPSGLTLTMMVNPSLATHGTLSAHLIGSSVDGIELRVVN